MPLRPEQIDRIIETQLADGTQASLDPQVKRRVTTLAKKWVETKKQIAEFEAHAKALRSKSKEGEEEIMAVVQELDDQTYRMDKLILSVRSRKVPTMKEPLEKALAILETLGDEFAAKAAELRDEASYQKPELKYKEEKPTESVGGWLKKLLTGLWDWLKRSEKKIAEAEQIILFGKTR